MGISLNNKTLSNFNRIDFRNFTSIISTQDLKALNVLTALFYLLVNLFQNKDLLFLFLPLGLVPAIGLTVILLSLNLTSISGLAPTI